MKVITVKELATKLRVHKNSVYNWIRRGMPVLYKGRVIRIDEEEAMKWLEETKNEK